MDDPEDPYGGGGLMIDDNQYMDQEEQSPYAVNNLPFGLPEIGADDMQRAQQQMQENLPVLNQRPPGIGGRLKAAIPDMITGGLNAVATPNIAMGGPVDIARGILSGQNAVRARQIDDERRGQVAHGERRRDLQTEAELALRKRQIAAADAQLERAKRPPARYLNLGGGAYLDQQTGKVMNEADIRRERAREERAGRASQLGLKPGTPEFNIFVEEGKFPEWYGKPPAVSRASQKAMVKLPAVTPEDKAFLKKYHIQPPEEGQPTVEIPETVHARIIAAEATAGRANSQAVQWARLENDKDKAAVAQGEKAKSELKEIEKQEYGDGTVANPGLHHLRKAATDRIAKARLDKDDKDDKDDKELTEAATELNSVNTRLRIQLRRKRDLGAISPEDYQKYVLQLQEYTPVKVAKEEGEGAWNRIKGALGLKGTSKGPGTAPAGRTPIKDFRVHK
jgi:hypothetical protein